MDLPQVVRLTVTPAILSSDPGFEYIGEGVYRVAPNTSFPIPKTGDFIVVECTDTSAEIRANDLVIWKGSGRLVIWCGKLSLVELYVDKAASYTVKHYALKDYTAIRSLDGVYQNLQGHEAQYSCGSIGFPCESMAVCRFSLSSFPRSFSILDAQLKTIRQACDHKVIDFI